MKRKFTAAVGSLLIGGVLAGAAVMPSAAGAHADTGPLCYGNVSGGAFLWRYTGAHNGTDWVVDTWSLGYNEPFRIDFTQILSDGNFWSHGHSASTNPVDYWVRTQQLRC